jgi:hypothetical protein
MRLMLMHKTNPDSEAIDTSALLRLVLHEPGALEDLRSCESFVSSELLAVESLRSIDRLRLLGALTVEEAEPFPIPLGTLDALHLSTALVWRDRARQALVMATHDRDLALAARSFGLEVRGV